MSVDRCVSCGEQVDTDNDLEFYDQPYTGDGHCWTCRQDGDDPGYPEEKRLDDRDRAEDMRRA